MIDEDYWCSNDVFDYLVGQDEELAPNQQEEVEIIEKWAEKLKPYFEQMQKEIPDFCLTMDDFVLTVFNVATDKKFEYKSELSEPKWQEY